MPSSQIIMCPGVAILQFNMKVNSNQNINSYQSKLQFHMNFPFVISEE